MHAAQKQLLRIVLVRNYDKWTIYVRLIKVQDLEMSEGHGIGECCCRLLFPVLNVSKLCTKIIH